MLQFKVSAQWMKSCGYGDAAKTFPVITGEAFTWLSEGNPFRAMYDLDMGNGRVWTVAAGRGKLMKNERV